MSFGIQSLNTYKEADCFLGCVLYPVGQPDI